MSGGLWHVSVWYAKVYSYLLIYILILNHFPLFLCKNTDILDPFNIQVDFEDQLHEAFSAGLTSYSGKRTWGFWDAVAFSMTTVSTIGII
jgi:hypothetical protein